MLCLCHCRVLEQFIGENRCGKDWISLSQLQLFIFFWSGRVLENISSLPTASYLSKCFLSENFHRISLVLVCLRNFQSNVSMWFSFCIMWITLFRFPCRWVCTCAYRYKIILKVLGVKICPFPNSPGEPSGITESGSLRTESWAPGHRSPFGMLASKARSSTGVCHQLIRKRWAGK